MDLPGFLRVWAPYVWVRVMRVNTLTLILVATLTVSCNFRPLVEDLATVNGQPITRGELQDRATILDLFDEQGKDLAGLLEDMITERLLVQQSDAMGVSVSDAELAAEMERFFASLDYRYQSRELALNQLQIAGLTNDAIADFLLVYLVAQAVIAAVKDRVVLTVEELQSFYDEHRDSLYTFRSPPSRVWQILLPIGHDSLAEEVLRKARAGGDFADLARAYSIDRASARRGGDLGYLTRADAPIDIADTIFQIDLDKVHGPVVGTSGLSVIRVTERLGAGTIPFERARNEVTNRVLPDKQDQEYSAWFTVLKARAAITRPIEGRLSPGKSE